jgi:hypothetical protein
MRVGVSVSVIDNADGVPFQLSVNFLDVTDRRQVDRE